MKTNSEKKRANPAGDAAAAKAKRPYVKPEVRHERVFETQALSCGKVQTTQGACHFNRRAS